MGVFGSETPGNGLSKIVPSNYGHGDARECNLKRGVPLHEQITHFMPPIILIYLWLGQITRPFESRSRGGESGGSDPAFFGLCVPVPPFQFTSRGHMDAPPWGVAPATVIPAGRLEVWKCKGL